VYRIGRYPGTYLAFVGAVSLSLAAGGTRPAHAQLPEPVAPLVPQRVAPPPPASQLLGVRLLPEDTLAPPTLTAAPSIRRLRALGAIGVEAAIGAGVTGFFAQRARALASPGGSWEIRVTMGSRLPLAFEGAYIGSRQNLAMMGLQPNGVILGNGGESNLRFNLTRGAVQPYVFAGAGWIRYRFSDTKLRTIDGQASENVFQMPFGAGLTVRGHHAFADARATGRFLYNDVLVDRAETSSSTKLGAVSSWSLIGRVGWQWF
jgi:hypothetical protein